jgi:hypothetical protein
VSSADPTGGAVEKRPRFVTKLLRELVIELERIVDQVQDDSPTR